jgi:hypothetical protein
MALTKARNRMIDGAFVSVKDFGAVGDGSNDDTSAIQAALNHAASLGATITGGTVYFPSGKYKITSTITYPVGLDVNLVNMCGNGRASEIYWDGGLGGAMFQMTGSMDANKKIYIENLEFNADPLKTAIGFYINQASGYAVVNVTFRHNTFDNMSIAIRAKTETDNIVFDNNWVIRYQNKAISLEDSVCNVWIIENNHFQGGLDNSLALYSEGSVNVSFRNNTVQSGSTIKIADLTDCKAVTFEDIYAEAPGGAPAANKRNAFTITDSREIAFKNVKTGGGFGYTGVPIYSIVNTDAVTVENVSHQDSGGSPPEFFNIDSTSTNIRFINAPQATTAFTEIVNDPLRISFGPHETGHGEITQTNQFVGIQYDEVVIAGSTQQDTVLDATPASGIGVTGVFLISAYNYTDGYQSLAVAFYDQVTSNYSCSSLHNDDVSKLEIVASGDKVVIHNKVTASRQCRWSITPLSVVALS